MSDAQSGPTPFDEPGLPGFEPPSAPQAAAGAYRVLARKYRPQTFADLIGQDAMVRTIRNSFASGRIPQAWMLTGVRGVGKTTTARILARGLNFLRADGSGGPTVDLSEKGVHCDAIIEGRHIDVMEIDAASNTGVDNVRQLNESVLYSPVSARYKVYIIDEVHMLSTGAFNAFLKTLEEPPPHAKFVFATTEIRKVPVTILSRCQRFDLRRVEAGMLVEHLRRICAAENVGIEDEALATLARAAEGSVRDSLSLLDQAIAHGAGQVTAAGVRDMLGLADRTQVIDLFAATMRGDLPGAFAVLRALYDAGADPAVVLGDLASFTNLIVRLKVVPEAAKDPALTQDERERGSDMAGTLGMRALSRAWQMLLKAIPEVQGAPRPIAAAEMALARLAYAADLPTPDEALRLLRDAQAHGATAGGAGAAMTSAPSGSPAGMAGTGITGAGMASPSAGGFPEARGAPSGGAFSNGAQAARRTQPVLAAETRAIAPTPSPAAQTAAQASIHLASLEDMVDLAAARRDIGLKRALEQDVRLVRLEDGLLEFALAPGGSPSLAAEIGRFLQDATGRRWMVAVSSQPGAPTLREIKARKDDAERDEVAAHPLVKAVLQRYPGARIGAVKARADVEEAAADNPSTSVSGDLAPADFAPADLDLPEDGPILDDEPPPYSLDDEF